MSMKWSEIYRQLVLAALVACCCIACINDNYDPAADPSRTGSDEYVICQIQTAPGATRAAGDGFEDGSDSEYALAPDGHHFALFFEADKMDATPVEVAAFADLIEDTPLNPDEKITKSLISIFAVDSQEYPDLQEFLTGKECLVVLNTDLSAAELARMTRNQLLTVGSGTILAEDGKTYFTMSSSVYVDGGAVRFASAIDTSKVFATKTLAREAALRGEATITTYAERLVAKILEPEFAVDANGYLRPGSDYQQTVNLFFGFTGDRYDAVYNPKNWSAKLVGYGVNGRERVTYLFKKLQRNRNYYPNWNAPLDLRSYWTEDPHYTVDASEKMHYPHQYRVALESDTVRDYHLGRTPGAEELRRYYENPYGTFNTNNPQYWLEYVSYDDLLAPRPPIYQLENTYDDTGRQLYDYGYFSAGTHLLVACELAIEDAGSDLYKDQNEIFYNGDWQLRWAKFTLLEQKAIPGGNAGINILHTNWKEHRRENAYVKKISWPANSKLYIDGVEATAADFTLIPAEIAGGDGRVLMAPVKTEARFTIANDTESEEIDYNDLVSLFHKLMGAFDHYAGGRMYYPAPIGHHIVAGQEPSSSEVGSVGLVRNHAYQIHVTGVNRPGRAVDWSGQPIIPMLDSQRDYIDMSIQIFPWHEVFDSNVPLYPDHSLPKPGDSN